MEMLSYDPATGIFTWIKRPKHRPIKVGDRAGTVGHKGYRFIKIDGNDYAEHRLAHLYMIGEWPADQTDHHDTKKDNNRWINIRPADGSQNQANKPLTKSNTSGFKGVSKRKFASGVRYIAQISHRGTNTHLGIFDTPEEAQAAYCKAADRLHGEFANRG